MLEEMIIITNNPMVEQALTGREGCTVRYAQTSYRDILCLARDEVHQGRRLLTHPLSGSVKPGETPYKSIAVSLQKGALDLDSLSLIEQSIQTCDKFPIRDKSKVPALQEDFQTIDLTLISSIF